MTEEWKWIAGYEGRYEVSNFGRIRSYANGRWGNQSVSRKLRLKHYTNGYPCIVLYKDGTSKTVSIHRLVAQAFIPNPDNLPEVNHKDGDKENNNVRNLEWMTCSQNSQHAIDTGLHRPSGIQKKAASEVCSIPVYMYDTNGNLLRVFGSITEASEVTKADKSEIVKCCKGKAKTAKGYVWKYAQHKSRKLAGEEYRSKHYEQ